MPNTDNITRLLTRQDIWRGGSQSSIRRTITTGHKPLDRLLHGGWPVGALTELLTQQSGIGELTLLLPMLRHYSGKEQLCVWLDPPYQPYAPSLAAAGIALHRLLIVRSKSPQEWLWAAEQSIRSGALLCAWNGKQPQRYTALRKLQLAASGSNSAAFLFSSSKTGTAPSPAILRLDVSSHRVNCLSLTLRKLRGNAPGASIQLALGEASSQRTMLTQLPVNTLYPQIQESAHRVPIKQPCLQLHT
jgi:hypothetical protein